MDHVSDSLPLPGPIPDDFADDGFSGDESLQSCHCFEEYSSMSEDEPTEDYQARKAKKKSERHPGENPQIPSFSEFIASGVASKDSFCHVVSILFEMMVDAGPDIFNDPQFFETCGAVVEDIPYTPAHEHELFEPSLRYIHSKLVFFSTDWDLTEILTALADGSRNENWRLPLARAGILDFALEKVQYIGRWTFEKRPGLKPRLRLICNCIADLDENRAIVAKKFSDLMALLVWANGESEIIMGFHVLCNLLTDYQPAQTQSNQKRLLDLITSALPRFHQIQEAVDPILQVLEFCDPELNGGHDLPTILANFALQPQLVETRFFVFVEALLSRLKPEIVAEELSRYPGCFSRLLKIYQRTVGFMPPELQSGDYPTVHASDKHPFEDADKMEQVRKAVLESIADFCNHDSFPVYYGVRDDALWVMISSWLESGELGLEVAACIILGNVLRGMDFWPSHLNKDRIQQSLIQLVRKNQDSSLTFSALGCLRNSAIFLKDSNKLVEYGIISCLGHAKFFEISVLPQLLVTTLALIRVLVDHALAVRELLGGSVTKSREPHFWFPALMDIFNRNDMAEIKVEIARITTKMIKTIDATPEIRLPQGSPQGDALEDIYDHEDGWDYGDSDPKIEESESESVAEIDETNKAFCQRQLAEQSDDIKSVLTFLCSLKEHPAIRSEVIFTLALLAKNEDPDHLFAQLAMDIVSTEAVHEFLDEVLEAGQKEETDKVNHKDWENAMVMLTELKRNGHEVNELMEKGWRGRRVIQDDETGGPRDP